MSTFLPFPPSSPYYKEGTDSLWRFDMHPFNGRTECFISNELLKLVEREGQIVYAKHGTYKCYALPSPREDGIVEHIVVCLIAGDALRFVGHAFAGEMCSGSRGSQAFSLDPRRVWHEVEDGLCCLNAPFMNMWLRDTDQRSVMEIVMLDVIEDVDHKLGEGERDGGQVYYK